MAKKLTKRKAFNFLRSYFDVLNEIESDSDKLNYLLAVINKQFLDEDPKDLPFIANLCYESQRHAIETSIKGYKYQTKTDLQGNKLNPIEPAKQDPMQDPMQGGRQGGMQAPSQQEKEKEKEKDKVQEEEKEKSTKKSEKDFLRVTYPFESENFLKFWKAWKEYKKTEHKFNYKSVLSEQAALKKLCELSSGKEDIALKIIGNSISNGWQGFFAVEKKQNGSSGKMTTEERQAANRRIFQKVMEGTK